jgi:glycosyltransferase involved in cell wall biosynthesis
MVKGFDIALIPFKKDDVSATIFPLKLFEYLGAGKPVVATNFNPDLHEFTQDTVTYCNNATAFSMAINEALLNDNEQRKQERLHIASQNTWEKRGNELSELIASHLPA